MKLLNLIMATIVAAAVLILTISTAQARDAFEYNYDALPDPTPAQIQLYADDLLHNRGPVSPDKLDPAEIKSICRNQTCELGCRKIYGDVCKNWISDCRRYPCAWQCQPRYQKQCWQARNNGDSGLPPDQQASFIQASAQGEFGGIGDGNPQQGSGGLYCWDVNRDGIGNVKNVYGEDNKLITASEDRNNDDIVDVKDCWGRDGQPGDQGDQGDKGDRGEDGKDALVGVYLDLGTAAAWLNARQAKDLTSLTSLSLTLRFRLGETARVDTSIGTLYAAGGGLPHASGLVLGLNFGGRLSEHWELAATARYELLVDARQAAISGHILSGGLRSTAWMGDRVAIYMELDAGYAWRPLQTILKAPNSDRVLSKVNETRASPAVSVWLGLFFRLGP